MEMLLTLGHCVGLVKHQVRVNIGRLDGLLRGLYFTPYYPQLGLLSYYLDVYFVQVGSQCLLRNQFLQWQLARHLKLCTKLPDLFCKLRDW
jgi:hypothetical protein